MRLPSGIFLSAALALTLSSVGCSGDSTPTPLPAITQPTPVPQPTAPTPPAQGKVGFWTSASRGWQSISITFSGQQVGNLTLYADRSPGDCNSPGNGFVVVTRAPGTYTYSARTESGSVWTEKPVTVTAGGCLRVELTCPNGDCGGGAAPSPTIPSPNGRIAVFLDSSTCRNRVPSARVFLDGRFLAQLYPGAAENTGPYMTSAGAHVIRAEASEYTWGTQSIEVPAGGLLNYTFYCY